VKAASAQSRIYAPAWTDLEERVNELFAPPEIVDDEDRMREGVISYSRMLRRATKGNR
jgi:hypothetical protein